MIVYGVRMDMLTKYVSGAVYILLYLSYTLRSKAALYYIDNALGALYGPMCAVAVCGVLINSLFHDKIQERDKTTTLVRVGSDVFGHILPFILLHYYGPTKTNIAPGLYVAFVASFFVVFSNYLLKAYIGVPHALLLGVAPSICIVMFYLRFYNQKA